jgi:hypothetical protein
VHLEEVIEISGLKSALKVLYKNRERRKMEFEEILHNLFSIKRKQSDRKLVNYMQESENREVYCKKRPIKEILSYKKNASQRKYNEELKELFVLLDTN